MGHHVQAIVAPLASADAICKHWPELPRLDRDNGFAILPVDAEMIDARFPLAANTAPSDSVSHTAPFETGNELVLLIDGFRRFLRSLSEGGALAYVETEYFGGVGRQGALVYRNGVEVMPPIWGAGTINEALALLGVERGTAIDEFDVIGFGAVRSNDDILERIARLDIRDTQGF